MADYMAQIPEHVRHHITSITATSGLPDTEESVERIAQAWLEKREAFEKRISEFQMEEWDEFAKEEERGALVMTYSGSLLTLGPVVDGERQAEYTSIGLRHDVPDSAGDESATLTEDVRIDEPVVFSKGPIQKSSAVFKIAVLKEELEPEEESKRLGEATQVLSEDFVDVNKTIVAEQGG